MPAKSQAQQRAAGAALSAKRGETKMKDLKPPSKSMAKSMSEKPRKWLPRRPTANRNTSTTPDRRRYVPVTAVIQEGSMLRYAIIFFIIAIIAAVFGFGGIAAGAAEIAKILFYIFVVIFLVTLLLGVVRR